MGYIHIRDVLRWGTYPGVGEGYGCNMCIFHTKRLQGFTWGQYVNSGQIGCIDWVCNNMFMQPLNRLFT